MRKKPPARVQRPVSVRERLVAAGQEDMQTNQEKTATVKATVTLREFAVLERLYFLFPSRIHMKSTNVREISQGEEGFEKVREYLTEAIQQIVGDQFVGQSQSLVKVRVEHLSNPKGMELGLFGEHDQNVVVVVV